MVSFALLPASWSPQAKPGFDQSHLVIKMSNQQQQKPE